MRKVISKKRTRVKFLLISKMSSIITLLSILRIYHTLCSPSIKQRCFVDYSVQAEAGSEPTCTIRNKQFLMHMIHYGLALEVNNKGSLPKRSD